MLWQRQLYRRYIYLNRISKILFERFYSTLIGYLLKAIVKKNIYLFFKNRNNKSKNLIGYKISSRLPKKLINCLIGSDKVSLVKNKK